MATPFTVASGAHKAAVNALDADAVVFAQGCPDFVPLIEQGVFSGVAIEDAVARYSAPLKEAGVDTVLYHVRITRLSVRKLKKASAKALRF